MDRRPPLTPLLACSLAFALVPIALQAQNLARLHVTTLALSSDRLRVAVGQPFHVTIALHVTETIGEPDNLFLPDLTNCEIEGTERSTVASATGTEYREILTLESRAPGRAHLSPARLLAIDARNGLPSQFASNDLTVIVGGSATPTLSSVEETVRQGLRLTALAATLALVIFAGIAAAVFAVRRRRPQPADPVPSLAESPRTERRSRDLRDALRELDRERSASAALRVRRALFTIAGASPDATLRDALEMLCPGDPVLRRAIVAAEQAAFRDGPFRPAAIDELLRAGDALAGNVEPAG